VVNWKKEIKVTDLDPDTLVEVICKKCGNGRYATQSELLEMPGMKNAYIDEIEKALRCNMRFCSGAVRVSLIYDDKTEGFVGGMA
jgi:hypothetical protein